MGIKPVLDRSFWRLSLVLAGCVMLAYLPVFRAKFVIFDDNHYVSENPMVLAGWSWKSVEWAFTTQLMGSWHPVTWLSHMMDVELFGTSASGHHATNLVLHVLNVVLAFALFRTLTGNLWGSALGAALFGLHPLHVESVAWVAERKDVLSGCFGLLTLLSYIKFAQADANSKPSAEIAKGRSRSFWFTLIFLTLGLMSKPMLVTWPLVMLLLDVFPLRRIEPAMILSRPALLRPLLVEKVPFFVLVGGVAALTWSTQQQSETVMSLDQLSGTARLANAIHSAFGYVIQFFLPSGLAMFYPLRPIPMGRLLLAAASLIALTALAVRLRRTCPWLLTGWVWYLIVLFPVSGVAQAGLQAHADRYTYLPSLGWSLAVVGMLALILQKHPRFYRLLLVVGLLPLLGLGVLTWRQTKVWQNSESLFRHALAVTRGNFMAHQGLGEVLANSGKEAEAKIEFVTALELYSRLPSARNNLGVILLHEGKFAEAAEGFKQALREKPVFPAAEANLAAAAEGLRIEAAIYEYEVRLAQNPNDIETMFGLTRCLMAVRRDKEALGYLLKIQAIAPAEPRLPALLADQYQKTGKFDAAASAYDQALGLTPYAADVCNNFAWLLATANDGSVRNGPRAVELAERACASTGAPQAFFLGTLAAAYAEAGRFDDAIVTSKRAIEMAKTKGREDLVQRNTELLKLYRAGKPYREPAR